MELVLVMFILGLLAAIAIPNISNSIQRAREVALVENLTVMRRAIGDYFSDRAAYPDDLGDLVEAQYIRFLPEDPVADPEDGWDTVRHPELGGIFDVRSTSEEEGLNGVRYSEW